MVFIGTIYPGLGWNGAKSDKVQTGYFGTNPNIWHLTQILNTKIWG